MPHTYVRLFILALPSKEAMISRRALPCAFRRIKDEMRKGVEERRKGCGQGGVGKGTRGV